MREVTGLIIEGGGDNPSEYLVDQSKVPAVTILSKECIEQLIKQMIPIDKNKHCALERNKREGLRDIARKKLFKHYGYE